VARDVLAPAAEQLTRAREVVAGADVAVATNPIPISRKS